MPGRRKAEPASRPPRTSGRAAAPGSGDTASPLPPVRPHKVAAGEPARTSRVAAADQATDASSSPRSRRPDRSYQPTRLARPERVREQPARARDRRRPAVTPTPAGRSLAGRLASLLGPLWVLGVLAATGGLITLQVLDLDPLYRQATAAALGVLLALGLSVRSGGRPTYAGLVALAIGGTAVATQWDVALAGAAVGTGVLAACLGVLGTTPASSFRYVVREVVLAQAVATIGALGVAGFMIDLDPPRFAYTVLALSILATIAMVYRLGAGLHGLGRRGLVVGVGAMVVLAVALAYTEALGRWGSPGMIETVDSLKLSVRDALGAVPHPIEVLLGIPALAWGVFMRARRRQGWWVCAFGTAATAPATTRLIDDGVSAVNTTLAATYSLVLGLLLGYLLIRLEQSMQGTHGRRARRGEEAAAHRPEPKRLRALH